MKEKSLDTSPCLHVLLSAQPRAIDDCRKCLADGDTMVMLADGVSVLLRADPERFEGAGVRCCYARADLEARGLLALALERDAEILEDSSFSLLLESHRHCLSWK